MPKPLLKTASEHQNNGVTEKMKSAPFKPKPACASVATQWATKFILVGSIGTNLATGAVQQFLLAFGCGTHGLGSKGAAGGSVGLALGLGR